MRRTFKLVKALFLNWIRSKSGVFFSIMFPVMLLLIFGSVFGGQNVVKYSLYVQNLDINATGEPTEISKFFIEALNSTKVLELKEIPSNVDARDYALQLSKGFGPRARILVITKGFEDKFINATISNRINVIVSTIDYMLKEYSSHIPSEQTKQIEQSKEQLEQVRSIFGNTTATIVFIHEPDDSAAPIVEGVIRDVASAFNLRALNASESIKLESENLEVESYNAVDYYLPGYISAFTMTNAIIGLLSVITDFKRRGIVKRLASTPLTKAEWVIANVLTQTFLALLLTAVMIFVAWIAFGVFNDVLVGIFLASRSHAFVASKSSMGASIDLFIGWLEENNDFT
ncbi:MAG: hypothetical protein B6U95_02755 [Thermofilum sp. ex4484_82]|nr:MAG: hypothetical protein B6U95_02755 [Thermofilum sp. ex4484_82]OYT39103.1 MAG: hypothetical protein B6U96_02750 [Archaeoglobales archaeon ex4484_92]